MFTNLREKFNEAGRRFKRLVYTTPIEVALGAMLIGAFGIPHAYHAQIENEGKTPIAFSEVGKTIREFEFRGEKVPPLTGFYGKDSDFAMQFFEARNKAYETSRSNESFAHELEFRMDPSFRVHRQIPTYAAEIPGYAHDALQSVKVLDDIRPELNQIAAQFDNVWSHWRQDFTRTVHHDGCDADGKNCNPYDEEVYDHSIQHYTYDAQQAAIAQQMLGSFLERHPEIKIDEKLVLATKTDPENEYAIEKSMKELLQGKIPTPLQALTIANTWATGSNLTTFVPVVQSHHNTLRGNTGNWASATRTSYSQSYRTETQSDSGPAEYQLANALRDHASEESSAAGKVTDGMRFAAQQAPHLVNLAREYIAVVLDHKPGNPDKIRSEMMSTVINMYESNYANGLEVDTFRWGIFLLWSSLSLLAGGALGKGVDAVLNKHRDRGFPIGDLLSLETWKHLKGLAGLESVITAEPAPQNAGGVKDDVPSGKKPRRDFTV